MSYIIFPFCTYVLHMKNVIAILLTKKPVFPLCLFKTNGRKKFRRYEWVKDHFKGHSVPVQVVWSVLRLYPVKQEQLQDPMEFTHPCEQTPLVHSSISGGRKTYHIHTKNDRLLVLLFIINSDLCFDMLFTQMQLTPQAHLHIQLIIHHTTHRKHTICKVNRFL